MSRRQLDPRGWHEIHERIVPLRQMRVYRFHDLHHRVGPGNRQHLRMRGANAVARCAEATRYDNAAVFAQRLADRIERLLDRGIDEATSVDQHQIRAAIVGCNAVTIGAQLRQDPFGVNERLRTAETHHANARHGHCA